MERWPLAEPSPKPWGVRPAFSPGSWCPGGGCERGPRPGKPGSPWVPYGLAPLPTEAGSSLCANFSPGMTYTITPKPARHCGCGHPSMAPRVQQPPPTQSLTNRPLKPSMTPQPGQASAGSDGPRRPPPSQASAPDPRPFRSTPALPGGSFRVEPHHQLPRGPRSTLTPPGGPSAAWSAVVFGNVHHTQLISHQSRAGGRAHGARW